MQIHIVLVAQMILFDKLLILTIINLIIRPLNILISEEILNYMKGKNQTKASLIMALLDENVDLNTLIRQSI